jgi:hypothetical protein
MHKAGGELPRIPILRGWVNKSLRYAQAAERVAFASAHSRAQRGEGAKAKAAPRKVPKKRGQGHYKGRSPVGSRPEVLEEPQ